MALRTLRSLCFDQALEEEVESFATHLACKHETYFSFAAGPDQGSIDDTKGLRCQGKPCAKVRDGVRSVLQASWVRRGGLMTRDAAECLRSVHALTTARLKEENHPCRP